MSEKTVIVTGGSQGIGEAITRRFIDEGYNVVSTSRNISKSSLRATDKLLLVDGDVGNRDTAEKVVAAAVKAFGGVDVLVNNAGIFMVKPFLEYTLEDFRNLANTNLEGFMHMSQAVIGQMLKQDRAGSIVSITTPYIHHPIQGLNIAVAMMTKGGIEAASKNLAMEFAKAGIRVNTVAPGIVDTPLQKENPKEFLASLSPIHGISTPEEIADAVLFLARAKRITGETISVDGGAHLGRW